MFLHIYFYFIIYLYFYFPKKGQIILDGDTLCNFSFPSIEKALTIRNFTVQFQVFFRGERRKEKMFITWIGKKIVYMCIYVYIHICIHTYKRISTYTCTYICIYTYAYVHIYTRMYTEKNIIYICVYSSYVYIHIYVYTQIYAYQ